MKRTSICLPEEHRQSLSGGERGTRRHPELDGTSLGLKVGLGGGLRLVAGKSFVLRADAAWSPDARPVGVYVAAGQAF